MAIPLENEVLTWAIFQFSSLSTVREALPFNIPLPNLRKRKRQKTVAAWLTNRTPPTGALSDVFGRRALWMLSILFFFVGAVIAGVATDMTKLLVGRCIQGVGGGGLTAMSEVIITDIIPLRQRGEYYGIMNAMWSLGSVTGPILGGGFAQSVSWVSLSVSPASARAMCGIKLLN